MSTKMSLQAPNKK